jgi:hypothetical protein
MVERFVTLTVDGSPTVVDPGDVAVPSVPNVGTLRDTITQHGVTLTFDQPYPSGQFISGRWWITPLNTGEKVTLTGISPTPAGGRNGFMLNPANRTAQGYDNRFPGYIGTPSLPREVAGGGSIVASISNPDPVGNTAAHNPVLSVAVHVAVLDSPPLDDGVNTFAPAYFGTDRTLRAWDDVLLDRLPSLVPPTAGSPFIPALAHVVTRMERVQLDRYDAGLANGNYSDSSRYLHPSTAFASFAVGAPLSNYGGDMIVEYAQAVLRLYLNDTIEAKKPALVATLQAALDFYALRKAGVRWPGDGAHGAGRKIMVWFAALMFGEQDMADAVGEVDDIWAFDEVTHIFHSAVAEANGVPGGALYGRPGTEAEYLASIYSDIGKRDLRDPYGQIDGGRVGTTEAGTGAVTGSQSYLECCLAAGYKGTSMAVRLAGPLGVELWNHDVFHHFAQRWVQFGHWTLPDTVDPDRFAGMHNTRADQHLRGTSFQNSLWTTYSSTFAPLAQ